MKNAKTMKMGWLLIAQDSLKKDKLKPKNYCQKYRPIIRRFL